MHFRRSTDQAVEHFGQSPLGVVTVDPRGKDPPEVAVLPVR
jgi:hypothetical protein